MSIQPLNKIQLKVSDRPSFRYLLLLFFTFLAFPLVFYREPQTNLDPSWKIAIHLATKFDLVFGKDFVFTYGPLGILYTRLPIAVPKIVYLLFDAFFLFNLLFILNAVVKKGFNIMRGIFLGIALIIVTYEGAEQWYFFFFLFHLLTFQKQPDKIAHLFLAALLSIICFYIKLSLGVIALVIFITLISYLSLRKKIHWLRGVMILTIFFIALTLSGWVLNVDIPGYIKGSLQIINAYNDSMFTQGDPAYEPFLYAVFSVLFSFISYVIYRFAKCLLEKTFLSQLDEFMVYGILGLFLFVLFKNGVVRYGGHVYMFFRGIVFFTSLLYLFAPSPQKKLLAIYSWILLVISFFTINTLPESHKPYSSLINFSIFKIKFGEIQKYVTDIVKYDPKVISGDRHRQAALQEIVGEKSIDVVPIEISQVYFNSLRYNPRPVIQSYSAYNGYLDSLNNQKYNSSSAPDFILYSLNSIDDRYAFFDEGQTKLAMLSNYEVTDKIDNQLVLSRLLQPKKLNRGKTEVTNVKIGEEVFIPPTSSLQFTRALIDYSIIGKIRRFLYKPPALSVIITLENGEEYIYKGITTILGGGVLLNKFIDTNDELEIFMHSKGELNSNVAKVRFDAGENSWGFKNDIKLMTTHYWLNDSSQSSINRQDSLKIQALFNKFKPTELKDPAFGKDSLRVWIDNVKSHSQLINMSGWAFLEIENNESSLVSVLLKSEKGIYQIPTINYNRPDLPLFYKRSDITNAAFSSSVPKNALASGNYQIGIRLINSSKNIDVISFTDKVVTVKKEPQLEKIAPLKSKGIEKNVSYGFDLIQANAYQINIEGWTRLQWEPSQTVTNIILESEEVAYRISTEESLRNKTANNHRDSVQLDNGFSVSLARRKLPNGIYKIFIEKISQGKKNNEVVSTEKFLAVGVPYSITPKRITTLPVLDEITKGIDLVKDDPDYLNISGWAVPDSADFIDYEIQIILKSGEEIFICDTESRKRTDVTAHFKNEYDLDNCGFSVNVKKEKLPKGKYDIGIYLHRKNKTGKAQFINQYLIR